MKKVKNNSTQITQIERINADKISEDQPNPRHQRSIPKHWAWVKLGDIGEVIGGGTPSTSIEEFFDGDIAWITPADLTGFKNKYISKGRRNITETGLKNSSARLIPKGSVLFSSRAPIGYVVISSNALCTNQGFKTVIPNKKVDSEFIYYFLKSAKQLAEKNASGTTFKEISAKNFANLPIPLPPLPEQEKIVEKIEELFSGLDSGVASLKKAKELVRLYRQSVLASAFSGKLTSDKTPKVDGGINNEQLIIKNEKAKNNSSLFILNSSLPTGWKWVKLGEVAEIKRGKSKHRPRNDPNLYGGKYPFIQTGEIRSANGGIINSFIQTYNETGLAQSKLWPKGTLCVSIAANIGETAFLGFDSCFPDSIVGILPNDSEAVGKYINYYFILEKERINGLAPATAQKNINVDIIQKLIVPLPPKIQQTQIVEEIESRFAGSEALEKAIDESLAKSETLRQSILKQAFSGKLIINNLE